MNKELLTFELHLYEFYFCKRIDGYKKIEELKRIYGGANVWVLYFGALYTDYGIYDYRLRVQIEIKHSL